jgi:hypothetical protein
VCGGDTCSNVTQFAVSKTYFVPYVTHENLRWFSEGCDEERGNDSCTFSNRDRSWKDSHPLPVL